MATIRTNKITNYERIKAMSIEEMVNFINRLRTSYCKYIERRFNCKGCFIEKLCDLPLSKTRQWLESEE